MEIAYVALLNLAIETDGSPYPPDGTFHHLQSTVDNFIYTHFSTLCYGYTRNCWKSHLASALNRLPSHFEHAEGQQGKGWWRIRHGAKYPTQKDVPKEAPSPRTGESPWSRSRRSTASPIAATATKDTSFCMDPPSAPRSTSHRRHRHSSSSDGQHRTIATPRVSSSFSSSSTASTSSSSSSSSSSSTTTTATSKTLLRTSSASSLSSSADRYHLSSRSSYSSSFPPSYGSTRDSPRQRTDQYTHSTSTPNLMRQQHSDVAAPQRETHLPPRMPSVFDSSGEAITAEIGESSVLEVEWSRVAQLGDSRALLYFQRTVCFNPSKCASPSFLKEVRIMCETALTMSELGSCTTTTSTRNNSRTPRSQPRYPNTGAHQSKGYPGFATPSYPLLPSQSQSVFQSLPHPPHIPSPPAQCSTSASLNPMSAFTRPISQHSLASCGQK